MSAIESSGYIFTGEMTDANGLVHLRARYYDPNVGVFASLDPFEGVDSRPMSVNGLFICGRQPYQLDKS